MPDSVLVLIERLVAAADELGDAQISRLVDAVQNLSRAAKLQILVAGSTGAGRASVVNALLDCPDVLPQTPIPKAPLSLLVRYGASPAAEVVSIDGARMALPADAVRPLLCDPAAATAYSSLVMYAPCEPLKTCEVRVEALEAKRSPQEWRDLLAGCDFVIVVLNATALLSQEERDFIRDHLATEDGLQRAAIVVNRMDLVLEDERASILDLVRAFLSARGDSQPVLLDLSTTHLPREEQSDHALRILLRDLIAQHVTVRAAALQQAAETALDELEVAAQRERAGASLEQEEIERVRQEFAARREWLQGRIERAQRRVNAFVGTLLREQLLQEIQGFGEVYRRRLPDEILAIEDISAIKRYLPGYMETVWRDFMKQRMIATSRSLLDEVRELERIIESDLRDLLAEVSSDLSGLARDFDAGGERLRAFVMPRRGKHSASSIARGLSLHGFVILIVSSIFGFFSPASGLLTLGASQVIRRIFKGDIEQADREAIVAAALAAERELERALCQQIDEQFARLGAQLQDELASIYTEGAERLQQLVEENLSRGPNVAGRQEQLAVLAERIIPELRQLLRRGGLSASRGEEGA